MISGWITEIDGKVLLGKENTIPTGDNKNWMIGKGLNPSRYREVFTPCFHIFYLVEDAKGTRLNTYTAAVDSYKITKETINYIEMNSDFILIYFDDYSKQNIIRVKPIIHSSSYKRKMRERKLNRVLNEKIG